MEPDQIPQMTGRALSDGPSHPRISFSAGTTTATSLRMIEWFRSILLSVTSLASAASACSPDPNFGYDDISSRDVLLVTATVKTFEVESSESALCWNVNYSDAQYLHGIGAKHFFVKTCWEKESPDDELGAEPEALDIYGFFTNASVVVGLVRLPDHPSTLRYAIPSCWGWMHINLGGFSKEERHEFLQELEDQIENAQ